MCLRVAMMKFVHGLRARLAWNEKRHGGGRAAPAHLLDVMKSSQKNLVYLGGVRRLETLERTSRHKGTASGSVENREHEASNTKTGE